MTSRWPNSGAFLISVLCWVQLAGVPVEDRMRRTPAAPARASGTSAGSGEDVSGNEDPPAAQHPSAPASKAAPTHSLWMLSRKFVRLLLTTQVRTQPRPALQPCSYSGVSSPAVACMRADAWMYRCPSCASLICYRPDPRYGERQREPSLSCI